MTTILLLPYNEHDMDLRNCMSMYILKKIYLSNVPV